MGGTALIFGFLLVVQGRSFDQVNDVYVRDMESNIFQEINILKDKNRDLRVEIDALNADLEQLSGQGQALDVIQSEIEKYEKLSGRYSVFGPGITVTIAGDITTPWAIDLINNFFNSGAEAIAVNGIRITNTSVGFDTLPKGQILLNGSILAPPFVFDVVGEPATLFDTFTLKGGILDKLKKTFPDLAIGITKKEVIQMG